MNPYVSTCCLRPYFPNAPSGKQGRHIGTGFLVASRIILTAAHNIIDPIYGEAARIRVRIGGDWITFSENSETRPFWVSDEWWNLSKKKRLTRQFYSDDYGFIKLPKHMRYGDRLGVFRMDASKPVRVPKVTVSGFPHSNEILWKDSGNVLSNPVDPMKYDSEHAVIYDVDTSGGVSGGPIFFQEAGTLDCFVVGIHTASWGSTQAIGVKVTSQIRKLISDFHMLFNRE